MKLSFVLAALLASNFSFAMYSSTGLPVVYKGMTPSAQDCTLSINPDLKGWSVKLEEAFGDVVTFASPRQITMANSAWISKDMMTQTSKNQFSSLASNAIFSGFHNVFMKCQLNSQNSPVAFTVDVQDVTVFGAGTVKRLVTCENLQSL